MKFFMEKKRITNQILKLKRRLPRKSKRKKPKTEEEEQTNTIEVDKILIQANI